MQVRDVYHGDILVETYNNATSARPSNIMNPRFVSPREVKTVPLSLGPVLSRFGSGL